MSIPISWYLLVAIILFGIGILAILTRRNVIVLFMGIELMLNGCNLTFLAFSRSFGNSVGHVSAFLVIAIAAAEAAIGLAITLAVFRHKGSVDVNEVRSLRG
ncbi:MAG: NADH-quinone oxidoreductase subunit NuoK [Myxococcales bacterium]|nr:NADH-quinone oxidoreductase subunit NuoK [Myxococcales bacterium]